MLFLMSFNNVGSPSITNSDEGQNCLSFMLAIALHWVTSWSAQIPRLRIFMPLAGSRGLRQFANKAGSSSTICPLYGWYQTMKFNLTMVTARELSICKKSWFLATRGDKIYFAGEDICKWMDGELALAGKKINSDITSNKLPSFFLSSYSSMMQISPKFDIVPCSLFSTKWKHQYKWLWVKDRVKVTSQHWATETVLVSNFASNTLQPHFKRLRDKRCTHLLNRTHVSNWGKKSSTFVSRSWSLRSNSKSQYVFLSYVFRQKGQIMCFSPSTLKGTVKEGLVDEGGMGGY